MIPPRLPISNSTRYRLHHAFDGAEPPSTWDVRCRECECYIARGVCGEALAEVVLKHEQVHPAPAQTEVENGD